MQFKPFDSIHTQDALLSAKKLLRNATLTLLLFSFALPLSHYVLVHSQEDKQALLTNISQKDPDKLESKELVMEDAHTLISKQNNLQVKFDLSRMQVELQTKKSQELATDFSNIIIKPPEQDKIDSVQVIDNKVVYSGANSNIDTVVESVDGGVRQVINIKSKDAPSYYDFPMQLQPGEKIELNLDGSAKIQKADGGNKIAILKPWARDANNKELKTWYEVVDSGLRQQIDLSEAVFPVLADPLWCGNFFEKHEWENRPSEGGLTIKNTPTWCGRTFDTGYGFDEIINNAPDNPAWPKSERGYQGDKNRSLYNQYRCHVWFAWFFKSSYNLEPSRPLVEWRTMITRNLPYACNP